MAKHLQFACFPLLLTLLIPGIADEPDYTPHLIRLARKAKKQGKTEITIVEPDTNFHAEPVSLKNALETSTAVLARPLQKEILTSSEAVTTWMKYRVTGYLSKEALHDYEPLPDIVPESFLPLKSDELIVITQGGTTVVEGVTITDVDEGDPGDLMKYPSQLLFLTLRNSGQVGLGAYGMHSFFEVTDNSSFKALSSFPMSPIAKDISRLGVNAVAKIKALRLQQKQSVK